MANIKKITEKIINSRIEHAWQKTYNSKDLALALTTEAVELNKLFLWHKPTEEREKRIREELADVFIYALLLLEKNHYDLETIIGDNLVRDNDKYPVHNEAECS